MAKAEAVGRRAAAAADLPQDLVFVDLETTGANAAFHRITEVGIIRMAAGVVVEEWSSLVNPECRIPPFIEAFTGISNDMVATAPRFAEIAALVRGKLASALFVAHNARFDYSFLRAEFRRLELPFSAAVMCTVKLSRRLFPQYPRHNLDALMERHQLTCTARHRALGDARVLERFWTKLRGEVPEERLAAAAQAVIGAHRLPPYLPADLADELPEGPGVYRFFGEGDVLLYIGKSRSLRNRILDHFAAGTGAAAPRGKMEQTRRVDWLETAGDLGAQLTEAQWIKTQRPLFNKRLKAGGSCTWKHADAARVVRLARLDELEPGDFDRCYGIFHTDKDARKALIDIARAHQLCLKVLGLEQGEGSCFGLQIGRCRGACCGREPAALHGARVLLALSGIKLKTWPFPGRIALQEGPGEFHVLDHWAYQGTARSEEELQELCSRAPASFDIDVYRILVRYFTANAQLRWRDLRARGAADA